jgi:hypothetical protein
MLRPSLHRRVHAAPLVALVLAACSGGGGGDSPKTVTAPPAPVLTTVTVSLSSATIQVGQTTAASAAGLDQNGAALAISTVTWSSSVVGVATISPNGAITAVAVGQTTIAVLAGGKSGQAILTVVPVPVALPTLTSFAPTHAAYGFTTVVTGTNFTPASTVTINGAAASVTAATATSLTVAIPSAGSSGPIRVTTVAGSVISGTSFTVDPYGRNIVISAGGTYSGNWQSLDTDVPAVLVTTSAAVTIENCRINTVTDGVRAYNTHVNLIIRNCTGDAVNPNVTGMKMGNFVVVSNFTSLVVEHNLITGFYLAANVVNYPPTGDSRTPATYAETFGGQTVSLRYNLVRNVEGRFSDGHGGFLTGNWAERTSGAGSAFTHYYVRNATVEIAWNEVVNQPNVSQTEDVINFPESRGTSATPMDVHDNYIEGARPANAATYTTFGGCGIQTGDSPSKTDIGFIHVHDNQIVNFASCGLSISSGHNIEFDHNRAISARTLPGGTLLNNSYRVPLQINDYYWDPTFSGAAVADPLWHDNSMHDNMFSAVRRDGSIATPIFIQMGTTVTQRNNLDALGHLAVTADEQAEYVRWQQKVLANGVRLGPIVP